HHRQVEKFFAWAYSSRFHPMSKRQPVLRSESGGAVSLSFKTPGHCDGVVSAFGPERFMASVGRRLFAKRESEDFILGTDPVFFASTRKTLCPTIICLNPIRQQPPCGARRAWSTI